MAWLRCSIRVKFLEERLDGATGSSIVVTSEGTHLAEVQALVPTMFEMPWDDDRA